jgi:hypothetical protein
VINSTKEPWGQISPIIDDKNCHSGAANRKYGAMLEKALWTTIDLNLQKQALTSCEGGKDKTGI